MSQVFDVNDFLVEAHTVKTQDNQIWINVGDGKFLKKHQIFNKRIKLRGVRNLYNQTKCVMAKGELIAKKNNKNGLLIRVNKTKNKKQKSE